MANLWNEPKKVIGKWVSMKLLPNHQLAHIAQPDGLINDPSLYLFK